VLNITFLIACDTPKTFAAQTTCRTERFAGDLNVCNKGAAAAAAAGLVAEVWQN
jgi:hypothetical protein